MVIARPVTPDEDLPRPPAHRNRSRVAAGSELWHELGRFGRIASAGIVLSAVLAVVLGFSIESDARRNLLEARSHMLQQTVADLQNRRLLPVDAAWSPQMAPALHEAVEHQLLGGDTIRLKLWAPDGTIVYSDVDELIGQRFTLGADARAAFEGTATVEVTQPTAAENVYEREQGELIEFYLPVAGDSGEVIGLVEIYQRSAVLDGALVSVRRNVWLSIGSGLAVLGVFMGSMTWANLRLLNRRRRHAQNLFTALLRAEDHERRLVVGTLHDDIGQPLYRMLYGLETCQRQLGPDSPVSGELAHLIQLGHELDETLRAELLRLHRGLLADLGLGPALRELARATEADTDLTVELDLTIPHQPDPHARTALFRAAQEAVTNIRKHAEATSVKIGLHDVDGHLVLDVIDDGVGTAGIDGLGLATTRERLAAVGGGLKIAARRRGGTHLRAWVPIPTSENKEVE